MAKYHTPLTDDEKGAIIRLARSGDKSVRAIGRELKRDPTTISRYLKLAGISRPKSEHHWSIYDIGELDYFLDSDFSVRAIGKILERTPLAISGAMHRLGFKARRRRKWLSQVYFRVRKSTLEAARRVGLEYDMEPHELFRCILRSVHRRDRWRDLLMPVHEVLLVGDRREEESDDDEL
jgi:IS30 family transposase